MLNTLNVVVMKGDDLVAVHAYFNTAEGKLDANLKFSDLIKADGATDDEVPLFLSESYYENGELQVFLKAADVPSET